jgi:hypothetical protein
MLPLTLLSLLRHSRTVIDTAYFYTVENEPKHQASLRDISEQVLGIKLPRLHDSVQDARAALQAAAYICKNGTAPAIVREASTSSEPSLLLHRIPDYCTVDSVRQMLISSTYVVPTSVYSINRNATPGASSSAAASADIQSPPASGAAVGKMNAVFSTQQHADLAFESIPGPIRPDASKRPQKRVYLQGGGYIYVRKN